MNKQHWETSYSIYEVVGYRDRHYEISKTELSLERYNKIAWRRETGEEIYEYDGRRLHHEPDYVLAEHRQSQLISVESLKEYEGMFV
jgi:hypothetical protein